jgi:quercetin dioxygenase-like cupin family protein
LIVVPANTSLVRLRYQKTGFTIEGVTWPAKRSKKTMTEVQMTAGITPGDQFETVRYPDDTILLRVTGGGNVQVVEYHSTDREGPPAHYHPWHEVEVVIEGEVEFYLHGKWIRGGPGAVQMLPAGVAHSVRVPSGSARLLYITIGPPYADMARELAALYAAGQADPQGVIAVANRHGVHLDGAGATL